MKTEHETLRWQLLLWDRKLNRLTTEVLWYVHNKSADILNKRAEQEKI